MLKKTLLVLCSAALAFLVTASGTYGITSDLGQHIQNLENRKKEAQKSLERLHAMKKVIEDEIGTIFAEIGLSGMDTIPKIGYLKTHAQGFVSAPSGWIVHSPGRHWVLDTDKLRKEYEQAGFYTPEEIDQIVSYHQAYVQNHGFTDTYSEQFAKLAEAKAQLRKINQFIERKEKELQEIELAIKGPSSSTERPAPTGGGMGIGDIMESQDGNGGGGGY